MAASLPKLALTTVKVMDAVFEVASMLELEVLPKCIFEVSQVNPRPYLLLTDTVDMFLVDKTIDGLQGCWTRCVSNPNKAQLELQWWFNQLASKLVIPLQAWNWRR